MGPSKIPPMVRRDWFVAKNPTLDPDLRSKDQNPDRRAVVQAARPFVRLGLAEAGRAAVVLTGLSGRVVPGVLAAGRLRRADLVGPAVPAPVVPAAVAAFFLGRS